MSLPVELLNRVCRYLKGPELKVVATSSATFCVLAQRILFRDVDVGQGSLALTVILSDSPHLGEYVRSFSIDTRTSSEVAPSYWDKLENALQHMPNLVRLSLLLPPGHSAVLSPHPTLYAHLESFIATFGLDEFVALFLTRTPALINLTLTNGSPSHLVSIPADAIPRLNYFAGSTDAARALAPGRPVSAIFVDYSSFSADGVRVLAQSRGPVTTLRVTTLGSPLPIVEEIAIWMPDIEYLNVSTKCRLWDEASCMPLLDALQEKLFNMNKLRSVDICDMIWRLETPGQGQGPSKLRGVNLPVDLSLFPYSDENIEVQEWEMSRTYQTAYWYC